MKAPFRIRLPATSANLGPAFDAAALAVRLYLTVRARPARAFRLVARGRDAAICGKLENNLMLDCYRQVLAGAGHTATALALEVDNDIPIGKGCGSSSAARLAGVAMAAHFGGLGWSGERIVAAAAGMEGHPDNVCACWHRGLVVARAEAGGGVIAVPIAAAVDWPLLLLVPAPALATSAARAVLPASYSRADAVANLQNALLLIAAWSQGRGEWLRTATQDRIHQPYRRELCPVFAAVAGLAGAHGILAVTLSGAGPSALVVLESARARVRATRALRAALAARGLECEIIATRVAPRRRLPRATIRVML